jgi:fructan beta-fructosidase
VLEVDMGNGSVAGGSGGEYFTGEFDGTTFKADSKESQWVDYGRDFYAPVSWADIPKADGRRIWMGWMNNWETCLNPTKPWRSAMSVPRALELARVDGKLRMVQTPVVELQSLRGPETRLTDKTLEGKAMALGLRGQHLELELEVDPGTATEVGVRVLKGKDEETTIRYQPMAKKLTVDRTRSGDVRFDQRFAGAYSAPLATTVAGTIKLRVLVDASSVEVFGNQGETVLTNLVYPKQDSDGVELFASGGAARVVSCKAWPLRSIWTKERAK